jgi:transposase
VPDLRLHLVAGGVVIALSDQPEHRSWDMVQRQHRADWVRNELVGDRPGAGRKPRLTEHERSQLIALVTQPPPGRLGRQADGSLHADQPGAPPHWTLDTLAQAAQALGILVQRSQVRRILLAEGVRWRRSRSWAQSSDPEFAAARPRSSRSTPIRRPVRRSSAPMSSGR